MYKPCTALHFTEKLNREIRCPRVAGSFLDSNSARMSICYRLRHVASPSWVAKTHEHEALEAVMENASIAG